MTKPEGPVARREDYEVVPCAHGRAADLVRALHYSKSAANTSVHAHCLVRRDGGGVVGAALWMPPTAKAAGHLARRLLGDPARHREVLNLSRLVIAPGEPKNAAGLLLGASERLVRRDPRWALLTTYADPARGHQGTIYRATNWTPDGKGRVETIWCDATGAQRGAVVSAPGRAKSSGRGRAGRRTRRATHAELRAQGLVPCGRSAKLRFVKRVR